MHVYVIVNRHFNNFNYSFVHPVPEATVCRCSIKISQSLPKNICPGVSFWYEACNLIKKETPVKVFSCEFCETLNNILFAEHLRATASIDLLIFWCLSDLAQRNAFAFADF